MVEAGRGKTRSINVSEDREHKFELFPTSGKIHRLKKQMLPTKAVQQMKGKGKLKPKKKTIPIPTTAQKQTSKKQKQAKLQEPKKIRKSYAVRAPNMQAKSQSIQYSQWNDRFGGAKPRNRLRHLLIL